MAIRIGRRSAFFLITGESCLKFRKKIISGEFPTGRFGKGGGKCE
jgi:hypothetical protein